MTRMYRKLPFQGGDPRLVAEVVNNLVEGKSNNTGEITLNSGGATTTTLFNERIGFESIILLAPLSVASAGTGVQLPHGLFEHDTTQNFSADIATRVALGEEESAYAMSLASDRVTVDYAGYYNVTFMGRFNNPLALIHNAYLWFRVNGVDVPHSAASVTVPDKQGSIEGASYVNLTHPLDLNANDYVEVYCAVDDDNISLTALAAQTTPYARPSVPSSTLELVMHYPSQVSGSTGLPYISDRQKGQATITHLPNNVADNTFGYIIVG
ncbi:hypothetical protein N9J50_02030 [Methylophilaceae bacterium]|nr:hypothetical protein [Methylophilaceae bacterium]